MKNCCYKCPRRSPGCHNPDTCEDWKEHLEEWDKIHKARKMPEAGAYTSQRRKHMRAVYERQNKKGGKIY